MEVHEGPERRVESLHERHAPRLRPCELRGRLLPARDLRHEQAVTRRQRVRTERHHAAHLVRRRQDPLPHRGVGQDGVAQVARRVPHPPRRARRARSTALAGVRDNELLAALLARDAEKTVGRDPAADVASELRLDVAREILAALLAHGGEEGLEVLAHHDVQRRELGSPPFVRRAERGGGRGHVRPSASLAPGFPPAFSRTCPRPPLAAPRFRVAQASSAGVTVRGNREGAPPLA